MSAIFKTILLMFLVTTSMSLQAKSHALLIGIGKYPGNLQNLEGPVNDVALVSDVLLKNENFNSDNIKKLLDKEATRKNILDALNNLQNITRAGDKVILYFSGHGTSALNKNINSDIPVNSGALIPYDIDKVKNADDLKERLLIGRRDLKPVLSKLDKAGVEVLVLVDACYSGNLVRGKKEAEKSRVEDLPAKFLDFSKLLPTRFQEKKIENMTVVDAAELIETVEYPYNNVFMLAAAQEDQIAQDIPRNSLAHFPTVDLKPHGAFTDSLVKALLDMYKIGSEKRANPSLTDLYKATSSLMDKYLSEPSLLPSDPALTNKVMLRRFFGQSIDIN